MKRIFFLICASSIFCSGSAYAWNLKDVLGGLGGASSSESSSSSATSGLGSLLGNLLSTDKITVSSLTGTWTYSAPAVTFKTDNVLKKAGGAAASAVIIEKLTPIYQKTGFDKAQLTVKADSTFTLKANKITLRGTISTPQSDSDSQANFVFNFAIAGKITVGAVDTYITKSATGTMSIMFDVTKLITIMETAGKITGNSTINSAVSLLKSYDGLCAGFEMKKVS